MLEGGRWDLAKQAIKVVIQGLTTNDFIGIVAFSSVGRVLGDRTALIRASAEVNKLLHDDEKAVYKLHTYLYRRIHVLILI
jgi:hypothetical protein